MANIKEKFKHIKAFLFDVDGVFTDGTVFLFPQGEMARAMNIKDGYAVQLAVKKGYIIGVISGGKSDMVHKRFTNLGVTDIYLGVQDKKEAFDDFVSKYQIDPSVVLYMGDDIPDYEVMKQVGMATCPADAAQEIKTISLYIAAAKGGSGCVREVIEQVLKLNNHWMDGHAFSW
jgi:3-deoxy-D-manno-octulosonate 8-phosphate phosphatase (KDO 8-P phosphatase)